MPDDFNTNASETQEHIVPDTDYKAGTPDFNELGNSGLSKQGESVYEDFLPYLRYPRANKIFKEMSYNDPVIGAILLAARQLIKGVTWQVKAASNKSEDLLAAEFLKTCLDDMSMPWTDLIDEITSSFVYGWAYHEIIYKRRLGQSNDPKKNSRYNDGRIGWRKISGRSQESWDGWLFDDEDDGSVKGMFQAKNSTRIMIPIEKALLFRTNGTRGNPEGMSFLRNAYRPWYFKKHIEEIEGIGVERDLAGLPVLIVPQGVDLWDDSNEKAVRTRKSAENLVKSIRRDKNEGVVLPFGWDLKLLASASSRQFDTNTIINRYDQRIAVTMLSDLVMLGADKVGSFALASVKKSLLGASLDAQVKGIADTFNRYAIPRLFSFNYFPNLTGYPTVEAGPVNSPTIDELGNYVSKLAGAKMPLFPNLDLENHLRRVANMPLVSENDASRQVAESDASQNNTNTGTKESSETNMKGGENNA